MKTQQELDDLTFDLSTKLSQRSVYLLNQHVRVFSSWYEATFGETFDPANLTNYDFHAYRKHSLDVEKVKAATWNSRLWALTRYCESIVRPELVAGIEQKAAGRASTAHRAITDSEYHKLIHTIEQDPQRALTIAEHTAALRDWSAISLMLQAGLRVDEAASVMAEDITLGERSGSVLIRNGKGSKERTVSLNLTARRALAQLPRPERSRMAEETLLGVTPRTLQRITNALGKRIGIPDLTPHWLRYTFAKRLQGANVPLETIRDLLGHKSIETTKIYLRSSQEELSSAVDLIQ